MKIHYEKFNCGWYEMLCAFTCNDGHLEVCGAEHRSDGIWFAFYLDGCGDNSRLEDRDYLARFMAENSNSGWSCGAYDSLDELIESEGMDVLRYFEGVQK